MKKDIEPEHPLRTEVAKNFLLDNNIRGILIMMDPTKPTGSGKEIAYQFNRMGAGEVFDVLGSVRKSLLNEFKE